MDKKVLDEVLVNRAYSLIQEKYSNEGGKKFILHLISAFFLNNKIKKLDLGSSDDDGDLCCITKCKVLPIDQFVPDSEGSAYYGYVSSTSNKVISEEAFEALRRFIVYRLSIKDDVITKISNYMNKNADKSDKNTKVYKKSVNKKSSNASHEDKQGWPNRA